MNLKFGRRRRVKTVLQSEAAECGLCCIAMVADYYGYTTDLVSLRRKMSVSQRGASLNTLIEISSALGLSARPVKLDLAELRQLKLPAVLHWNFNHFVVLSKVTRLGIVVHDPAVGCRRYSMAETSQRFTGVALEFAPRQEFASGQEQDRLRLMDFYRGTKGLGRSLAQIFVLSVILQIFALATPFYIQVVVDDVLVKNDVDLLEVLALGFLCVTLFAVAGKALRGYSSLFLANRFSYNVGNSVLHHLLRLPVSFFEKRHMGDLVSRFGATQPVQDFITGGIISIVIDGLLAMATFALMLWYAPHLAAVVAVSLLLYAGFRAAQYTPLRTAQHENIVAGANLESHFMETMRGIQGLKIAKRELDRQIAWQHKFAENINTGTHMARLGITYETINGILTGCEYVLIIYLGAQDVLSNVLTIGMLYAFLAYRSHFSGAMVSIIDAAVQFKMLGLHMERLADITQTSKETDANIDSTLVLPVEGGLVAEGLSFAYAKNEADVFSDFSIDIVPGQFIALFGPSGIGKTTLMKNLMGLLSPSTGTLKLDDYPLSHLGLESLRHHTAAVMQNDCLFTGSIKENVTFFEMVPDMQQLKRACELSAVHDEILASPMGYETLIGDMGAALSAGQQQRILLARCLYRNPKMLFLDEGTAHIDEEHERIIMDNLKSLGITCIFITHNPALLAFADQVVYWKQPGQPRVGTTDQVSAG